MKRLSANIVGEDGCGDVPDDMPDVDTVLQREDTEPTAVPVHIADPIRTESLPLRLASARTVIVNTARRLLNEDPKRGVVTLWTQDEPVRLAGSEAGARDQSAALLTAAVGPVKFNFQSELWAEAQTTDATVTVIVEQWTR